MRKRSLNRLANYRARHERKELPEPLLEPKPEPARDEHARRSLFAHRVRRQRFSSNVQPHLHLPDSERFPNL